MKYLIFFLTTALIGGRAFGGDVDRACAASDLKVIALARRDQKKNIEMVKKSNLGESPLAKYIKELYLKPGFLSLDLSKSALKGNQIYIADSPFKSLFLDFSGEKEKLADPKKYHESVLLSLRKFLPKDLNKSDWLLNLNDSTISRKTFRPALSKEKFAEFGAVANISRMESGKYELSIIYSNNGSEPIPYLVPLIAHEFEHLVSYKEKIKIKSEKDYVEYQIVEEAKGFEAQMKAYVAIAKKWPNLFCNWLYVTWSYGDLLVPLSWTMASMEKDMAAGDFIFKYAQIGPYEGKDYLLNPSKTALRPDIQKRIESLKLRYIK